MAGMLTIDADAVRAVAEASGRIAAQLRQEAEQLAGQFSLLQGAVSYEELGASQQFRQALTQLQEAAEQLLTAQTKLMAVVSDTLHTEQDIEAGAGRGVLAGAGGPAGGSLALAGSPGGSGGGTGYTVICPGPASMCSQIDDAFLDPRTRQLMYTLLYSPTGRQFVQYYLEQVGSPISQIPNPQPGPSPVPPGSPYPSAGPQGPRYVPVLGKGDSFITWDVTDPTINGQTYYLNGTVHLNPDILGNDPKNPDYVSAAGVLVHEGVESYLVNGQGLHAGATGTMHADYLAQWYAGKVMYQLDQAPNLGSPYAQNPWQDSRVQNTSYGLNFETWLRTPDGQTYFTSEPVRNWEDSGIGRWFAQTFFPSDPHAPDGMGVTVGQLSSDLIASQPQRPSQYIPPLVSLPAPSPTPGPAPTPPAPSTPGPTPSPTPDPTPGPPPG